MTLFNGNTFPVADEELAHENGPEDALLQQHLMAQHMYLGDQRGNRHGFSPKRANNSLASHLGDKTFASVNRTCPWQRLVWVYPDRSGLTVKILGRVNSEAPTAVGAKMFVSLEIEGFGTQNYTLDETANYTTHTLDFLIDEPPSSPVLVGLRLWVKSQVMELDTTNLVFSSRIYPGELIIGGFYPVPGFPGPSANTYHEKVTSVGPNVVDHLVLTGEDSMIVYPPNPSQGTGSYTQGWLSYMQVRGIYIEEHHNHSAAPVKSYRSNIPSQSALAMRQALASYNVLRRPRLLSLGNTSLFTPAMNEIHHYHDDWMYVRSDDGFPTRQWMNTTVFFDEPSATIRVCVLYVPFYLVPSYAKADVEQLEADAAVVDWIFGLTLTSKGAVNTNIIEHTEFFVERHYPTDCSGLWPVLTQLRWREYGSDGPQHPTLMEGQCFLQDLELVRRREFLIDARDLNLVDINEPLEMSLTFEQNGVAQLSYISPEQSHHAKYLGFCEMGTTTWAHHG